MFYRSEITKGQLKGFTKNFLLSISIHHQHILLTWFVHCLPEQSCKTCYYTPYLSIHWPRDYS